MAISSFDEDTLRLASPEYGIEESDYEINLRPKTLDEYIGQEKVKDNLDVYMHAALKRNEPLDHVLLYGPPGLGKTTLAGIIANTMGSQIRITSGPAIEKPGDLAALLTNLNEGDILFIDEIHRLSRSVEEVLYPAMEDNAIDIIIGKGPSARSIRLDLQKFTLVAATTRSGSLSAPLRDRFGVVLRLELYTPEQLSQIVKRSARILGIGIDDEAAIEIASQAVRKCGHVALVGVYGTKYNNFPLGNFLTRNITLKMGQCPATRYVEPILEKIKSGEFDATDIITHKLSLEEGRHAYEIFDAKEDNCIKVILKP